MLQFAFWQPVISPASCPPLPLLLVPFSVALLLKLLVFPVGVLLGVWAFQQKRVSLAEVVRCLQIASFGELFLVLMLVWTDYPAASPQLLYFYVFASQAVAVRGASDPFCWWMHFFSLTVSRSAVLCGTGSFRALLAIAHGAALHWLCILSVRALCGAYGVCC